ncbi:serine hydrolase domain-containing protein [Flagellimonas sp. S174]|uniref:serine hydrolase domain-containing protein n=1 Tax=Flagellimonas sp. S174 TaxID=3410790 RepID=UPI003BF4DCD1
MKKHQVFFLVLSLFLIISCAQKSTPQPIEGEWIGHLPNKNSFNFEVSLEKLEDNKLHLTLTNGEVLLEKTVKSSNTNTIEFNVNEQLFFNLKYSEDQQALTGFIKSARFLYHVNLPRTESNKYIGDWNAFMVDNGLQSDDIMLYTELTEGDNLVAYPFFGDQRFRGAWAEDFKRQGDTLLFKDGNTGLNFRAKLLDGTIELEIFLTDVLITKTSLTHTTEGWDYNSDAVDQSQSSDTPAQLNDGWTTANGKDFKIDTKQLDRLIQDVHAQKLVNTHSVLIAKENKLVFETYFDGNNANIPHDLRSASKSISSAVIGIAIDEGILESVDESLYSFIPKEYQHTKDDQKAKIRIKDLLTMSSGMDVNKLASEDYYQNPSNPNSWLQTVLEAPMVNEPGTYFDYGSANPFLLGVCLNARLDMPMETYMHEKLFAPLGITNYINQTDDTERVPYFGGGMLLTSRDLLKFGQLFLNQGEWNGKQVISAEWVAESFGKYGRLQDTRDKNEYGYLWWHDSYEVNGKPIAAIEARGAGGQFIFILPELEAVVVMTSGNFRNRKGNQPRDILQEYILPALAN